ncbi:hypothetical protein [Nonomuraea wenchangensis]|uniref:hypothetical protein n=1 Tax=Nonomuraea wenchangensis TaxID=568860 RepID=UPI00332542AF
MKPAALPGDRDMRVWDVLCAGTTLGVLAWGAVGAWTAATIDTYPWNAWIPFPVGAAKGAVLGLLAAAAVLAVLPKGPRLGRSGPAFCAAFVGGSLPGTARTVLAASADPAHLMALLPHWAGTVALPAVACAAALAVLAGRPYRPGQSIAAGATLALAGGALVLVPVLASALAPEIRGNGGHANEGPLAILLCWSVGLPVLFAGLVRWGLLLRRRAGGGRPAEPAAAIRPVVRP